MTRKGQRSNRAIDPDENTVTVTMTLLPRHRDYAKAQPGGMSAFIRDLIDRHMKRNRSKP